jgi:2-C-methyl-D-erythritol 4-phosphate cytidylyltransferase
MNVKIMVPEAGKEKRFGEEVPKQFNNLAGQPIIFYAVKKLITSPLISGGVIVCGTKI